MAIQLLRLLLVSGAELLDLGLQRLHPRRRPELPDREREEDDADDDGERDDRGRHVLRKQRVQDDERVQHRPEHEEDEDVA